MIFIDPKLWQVKEGFVWKVYELAAESLDEEGLKLYARNLPSDESRTIYYADSISDLYDPSLRESWVLRPNSIIPTEYLYNKYTIRDVDITNGWLCDYVEDGARGFFRGNTDGTWNWSIYARDVSAYRAGVDTGTVVKSVNPDAYPANGWIRNGKYWYIRQ